MLCNLVYSVGTQKKKTLRKESKVILIASLPIGPHHHHPKKKKKNLYEFLGCHQASSFMGVQWSLHIKTTFAARKIV